jgi:predicted nucleic acid-binding protein
MLVYLDSCCFSRPFTDMGVARNQRDASDFRIVQALIFTGRVRFACSNFLFKEIGRTQPTALRRQILALIPRPDVLVPQHSRLVLRIQAIANLGLDEGDSIHTACAEEAGADFLLTTDDDFAELARQYAILLKVKVLLLHDWLDEVLDV